MKRFFRTVGIVLLCGVLLAPAVDAQSRGRNNNNGTQKSAPSHNNSAPSNQSTPRPGNSGQGSRPGNSGQGNRPGNSGQGNRPGNSGQGNRPGNSGQGNRPNSPNPGGPVGANRPNYNPTPRPPQHGAGPQRPNMPPTPPHWYRPTPPPSWRPPTVWRPFNSILGVAFGSTLRMTINALVNSGYVVSQYGSDALYVADVRMLNMFWPDAVLYYNNVGGLCGSRFIYTSRFQDMTRYNSTYATLVASYGSPYSIQNTSAGIEANWWGPGNQFITLSYGPEYTPAGSVAFYTTLAFGY